MISMLSVKLNLVNKKQQWVSNLIVTAASHQHVKHNFCVVLLRQNTMQMWKHLGTLCSCNDHNWTAIITNWSWRRWGSLCRALVNDEATSRISGLYFQAFGFSWILSQLLQSPESAECCHLRSARAGSIVVWKKHKTKLIFAAFKNAEWDGHAYSLLTNAATGCVCWWQNRPQSRFCTPSNSTGPGSLRAGSMTQNHGAGSQNLWELGSTRSIRVLMLVYHMSNDEVTLATLWLSPSGRCFDPRNRDQS